MSFTWLPEYLASRNYTAAELYIVHRAAATTKEVDTLIKAHWKMLGGPLWRLAQSIERLVLDRPESSIAVEGTLAGRVFGSDGEMRWLRDGPVYQLWLLSSHPIADVKPNVYAERRAVRYYFLGGFENGVFSERHLSVDFAEHYSAIGEPKDNDRPYAEAIEYRALPVSCGNDMGELERQLNQPEILAYRFIGIHLGQDTRDEAERKEAKGQ